MTEKKQIDREFERRYMCRWISSKEKQIEYKDLATLDTYRNKYYADGNSTEQGLVADAINNILPILLKMKRGNYRKQSEWISVDERLPENGAHSLISCTIKRIDGTHGHYVCVGYYAEKFKHLAYGVDDDCVSEYNEEDDEFYISEGWYEVIKNWDDYGFVAISDFVTHWMPLPEPPKMKGESK